jgi:uroporphyrinogen decarboxylase
MKSLTHRERVLTSLNHQEPDRVPLDFGGIGPSEIVVSAYENLKKYLGVRDEPKPLGRSPRTVVPDETVLQKFDIDTRTLRLGEFKTRKRKIIDADTFVDEWETTWKRAPGQYYVCTNGAFQKSDPKIELLETFHWPDPDDPGLYEGLKEKAESLRKNSDFAIVLSLIHSNGILKQCTNLRGFTEFLMDLYENREFACCLLDRVTDISIRIAENALDAVGKNVDVVFFADDLGHQQATFMSPKDYREIIKPRHKRFFTAVKSRTDAKILMHSDGSVYAVIEDLIDAGVDVLNPVQVSARNMDPATLKKEFGNRLGFWGAIDTRDVLPFRNPKEVREETRRIIDLMGKGGGYVLTSVQSIQAEVPPENIAAMFEEARSYGVYGR